MLFNGYKNHEIAERLEMTESTVSQIIRSPLGQAYLEGLQDKAQEATLDVRKKLVSMNKSALDALDRLLKTAKDVPASVQLGAAKDVLDRTGFKAPDKLHIDMTYQMKTDQEIDAEIAAMQQSINKTTNYQIPKTSQSLVDSSTTTNALNAVNSSPEKTFSKTSVPFPVEESTFSHSTFFESPDEASYSEDLEDYDDAHIILDDYPDEDFSEDSAEIRSLPANIFHITNH